MNMHSQNDRGQKPAPGAYYTKRRFHERTGPDWHGPLIDYKEIELLRKFLTSSSKLMGRRRAGTNVQERRALRIAVKRARFLALVPYSGS